MESMVPHEKLIPSPDSRPAEILDVIVQACLVGFIASTPISIAFCQCALGIGWAVWLARCFVLRRWNGYRTFLDSWFVLFFGICLLSTVFSAEPLKSLLGMKKFYLFTVVYFISFNIRSQIRLMEMVRLFILMTGLSGIYGIAMNLLGFQPRLLATQGMALTSGGIFMASSLLAVATFRTLIGKRKWSGWWRLTINFLLLISLFLTKAVSSWLGWISGMLALLTSRKKFWVALILFIITLGTIPLMMRSSWSNFLTVDKGGSWQVRTALWRVGWRMIKDRPVLGYGLVDLAKYYPSKETSDDQRIFRIYTASKPSGHLHNNFVQITAITGFAGLTAFVTMWTVILCFISKKVKQFEGQASEVATGVLAVVSGFLVNGLFEWNFGDSEVITVIWFLIGLAIAIDHLGAASIDKPIGIPETSEAPKRFCNTMEVMDKGIYI